MGEREQDERRRALARRSMTAAGQGSERALAATAHGAIAFGFVGIGFLLSLAITAVIWLASRRSTYVREQSDRAGLYQLFVLIVNILAVALWILGFALLLWLTGWRLFGFGGGDPRAAGGPLVGAVIFADAVLLIIAVPVFAIWYIGTIVYGIYGAFRALGGHDFRYPPAPWGRRKRRRELARAAQVDDVDADTIDDDDGDGGYDESFDDGADDPWENRKLRWRD